MSLVCPKLWRNDHFERLLAPDILNVNKYEAMSSLVSLWDDQGGCGTLSWGSFYARQKPLKNHARPKWRMLLEKTRVVTYVAGTGHICIWWCGCTDHKFLAGPVGLTACLHLFSLYISVSFPSVAPPPPPVRLCLPNESVWLAVCCCQGAGEGDYSCRTGPGPGRPELTTGKKGFWKIPPKQQLPSSIFHFFLFCPMLVIDWRRGEKKVPDQSLT